MVRIKQILCPVDFSEFSRHALDRAIAIARAHGAAVTALHVLPARVAATVGVPVGPEGPGPFILHDVDREKAGEQLMRFIEHESTHGLSVRHEVVEASSIYREILRQADRVSADLIVMGTHGRSGFERLLIGSVTEKVLRRASVPVLSVPRREPDLGAAASAPFRRIICAVDFSECSLLAIAEAAALARDGDSRFTIVHVVELLPVVYEPSVAVMFDPSANRPALEEAARAHLRRFVPEGIRQQCDIENIVVSGKPYVEILKLAAARNADLITLGVHGYSVIDRLVFGSTAMHVVRHATCPVLTVRERHERRPSV